MNKDKIPFVDLAAQYASIKNEIDSAISNVIKDTAFIKGKYVKQFENEFADKYNVKHCISCANGTDAIYITLKTLGIKQGDEVITVANSWISTSETISQTGAKPIFIDIEKDYYTINSSKIEEKITSRTKAIIPVHLYGQTADMDSIIDICKRYDLYLIEDCAQAHFAEWKGNKAGTMGIAGTFSFFPGKNLGAYGDAGAIISNDDEFAEKARMYANHGALVKHNHNIEGINSRLDGIQAAILSVKLKYIDMWTADRIKNAQVYNKLLDKTYSINIPSKHSNGKHVYHLYVVRSKNRYKIIEKLQDNDISFGIHYPTPLPFLKAYSSFNYKYQEFPVSWQYKDEIISLPMYPELTVEQITFICDVIKESVNDLSVLSK